MTTPTAQPLPEPEPECYADPVPDFPAGRATMVQMLPTWTAESVREAAIAQRRPERRVA